MTASIVRIIQEVHEVIKRQEETQPGSQWRENTVVACTHHCGCVGLLMACNFLVLVHLELVDCVLCVWHLKCGHLSVSRCNPVCVLTVTSLTRQDVRECDL